MQLVDGLHPPLNLPRVLSAYSSERTTIGSRLLFLLIARLQIKHSGVRLVRGRLSSTFNPIFARLLLLAWRALMKASISPTAGM